jgi:hypothetical protein
MNYEKIYNDIISKARSENRKKVKGGIYYEAHHIIPKCMGGEGMTYQHNHTNIILLTAKEHYIAHRLLCEIYPDNNKLRYALWMMINGSSKYERYIPSSKIYENLKKEHSSVIIGKKHSETTRKKMSVAASGKFHTEYTKSKLASINKGKIVSAETKIKQSESAKKKPPVSEETRKKMSEAASIAWKKKLK